MGDRESLPVWLVSGVFAACIFVMLECAGCEPQQTPDMQPQLLMTQEDMERQALADSIRAECKGKVGERLRCAERRRASER